MKHYDPNKYFVECVCSGVDHVFNIIVGKETGTTFPISVQDKEVNALLDTGAEKSCICLDMFSRLKLPLNVAKIEECIGKRHKDTWQQSSQWETQSFLKNLQCVKIG